ncbi:glycosyltransferase family 39 protein [Streptomyces lanatus]|uniref:Glycosyltransferase family 39 protein n=1 Tax=Streptomyces lanatus TaxID=66900 RepID=A0ABV1XJG3_9ACTN|nr:glycosyltransferase family 39 protein [Streptomyces lanatus]GHG90804.1 hypothetical protein GCM10018780_10800 [Streptomyces lanatus]
MTGLWGIRRQGSLWQDEAVTYDMAHRELPELWATLGHADAVHGLYYLLMHGLFRLWEGGLVALRLPSVLAMAAATAGVAALGRRLAGPRAGLAAGVVFALLPAVQRYAQEGRSYALVTALVVAQTWVLLRACTARHRRRAWWAGYAVLVASAGLLHEFALLALVAHGVALLAARPGRAAVVAWAVAGGCAAATVTPLVLLSLRQSGQVAWIEVSMGGDVTGFLLTTGIGLACVALRRRALPAHPRTGLDTTALPLLTLPPALLLLASAVKPLYVDRYVLYAQAGLALLAGAALDALWRSGRARTLLALSTAVAVGAALGPVGTHLRGPQSRTDDVTAISHALRETVAPGDGVLFLPGSRRVWTLGHEPASYGALDLALAESRQRSHTLYGTELPPSLIPDRLLLVSRVVVVREPARERHETGAREETKEATLRDHFTRCARTAVGTARIEVYRRGDHC